MGQPLPRKAFDLLYEAFGDKHKAEVFAQAVEVTIAESIEHSKVKVKEDLRNELVTRELFEERFKVFEERFKVFEERFKVMEEKFKHLEFRINVMIGIAAAACTVFNPGLLSLLEKLIK
jgi:hypothetical protein